VHTVLVDMRARLARSARQDRIFEVTIAAARRAPDLLLQRFPASKGIRS
jgi:hypothetical protein